MTISDYFYNKGYDNTNHGSVSSYLNDRIGSYERNYKSHIDKNGIFLILLNRIIIFELSYQYSSEEFDQKVIDFMEKEIRRVKFDLMLDEFNEEV